MVPTITPLRMRTPPCGEKKMQMLVLCSYVYIYINICTYVYASVSYSFPCLCLELADRQGKNDTRRRRQPGRVRSCQGAPFLRVQRPK